jgi:hypothetical protein
MKPRRAKAGQEILAFIAPLGKIIVTGLPFGLFKGQICQIWPFLKLFARNKLVWPFGHFLAFFEC